MESKGPLNSSATEEKSSVSEIDTISIGVPLGTSSDIQEVASSARLKIDNLLRYTEGASGKIPFEKKKRGDTTFISLPSNFEKLMENGHFAIIFELLKHIGLPFEMGDYTVELAGTTEDKRLFWAGFANRLLRPLPGESKSLNFTITKKEINQSQGRSCADAEAFLLYCKIPTVFQLLPDSVKVGIVKSKLLSSKIAALAGFRSISTLGELPQRLAEATKILIEKDPIREAIVTSSKVSPGSVTSDLTRTQKVTKKGKTVLKAIHLSKPSTKVEAFLNSDKIILRALDKPWDDIGNLTREYQDGIPLNKVEEYRTNYKIMYDKTFEVTKQLTSWAAKRRRLVAQLLGNKRKNANLTGALKEEILTEIADGLWEKGSEYHRIFDQITPKYLLRALGKDVGKELALLSWDSLVTGYFQKPEVQTSSDLGLITSFLDSFGSSRLMGLISGEPRDEREEANEAYYEPDDFKLLGT
jgi:hypothetical protein